MTSSVSTTENRFALAAGTLADVAAQVLDAAREGGASAAEAEVSQAFGQSVTVRKGDVETIAYNRDKGIGVTVYAGLRRGHASTADFAPSAIRDTLAKALTIARNLNAPRPRNFTTCDMDMIRHYRPRVNVVVRPTNAGGKGYEITGHHEIMVPMLAWAIVEGLEKDVPK